MEKIMICENCFRKVATEKHHLFSQTKINRKVYGWILDEPFNIKFLCYDCHHNKSLDKYTEKQFRNAAEFRGYELPEGTKSFRLQDIKNLKNICGE
jgi:hypothetical protein